MSIQHFCDVCLYSTYDRTDYEKHLRTRKHKLIVESVKNKASCKESNDVFDNNENVTNIEYNISCKNCNRMYKTRQGLWNHAKKCRFTSRISNKIHNKTDNMSVDLPSLYETHKTEIFSTMKENPQFQQIIAEQNTKLMNLLQQSIETQTAIVEKSMQSQNFVIEKQSEIIQNLSNKETVIYNNSNNTNNSKNNTNNNHFNINNFLNEKCKNAMNIADFVDSLEYDFNDLVYLHSRGYAEGITNIMLKGLQNIDIYERPIHCTDVKRETFYVKDKNQWEKDSMENKLMDKIIEQVTKSNMRNVIKWKSNTPQCEVIDSKEYNFHIEIMKQSINGGMEEESKRNENRIRRNLARAVYIDRNKI